MAGDIKLDGDWVVVEGNWTRIRTWDLMLDAPGRRITQSGQRRALVHDNTDRLTINYGDDYPNGVHISGKTSMETTSMTTLHVTGLASIGAALHVKGPVGFAESVTTPKLWLGDPVDPTTSGSGGEVSGGGSWGMAVDVGAELKSLRDEIAKLKARVAALEQP